MEMFRRAYIAFITVWLGSLPISASAQTGRNLIVQPEHRIVDTDDDIFLVTVSKVSDHDATREKPPRVTLNIHRTVRGPGQQTIRTDWEEPYDPNYYGDSPVPPLTDAQKQQIRDYANETVTNPKIGSKWAIIGHFRSRGETAKTFIIQAKYPLSKERRSWIDSQVKLREQYAAERRQYQEHWPPPLLALRDQMPAGARRVTSDTDLPPGTQVLIKFATTAQGSVIQVMEDGQVKIRPRGRDSRGDVILPRDQFMLYPETNHRSAKSPK
jgi:hypothetical protein